MNKKKFIAFLAGFSFLICQAEVGSAANGTSDSLLYNIQSKVLDAFMASHQSNSPDKLVELQTQLKGYPVQNQLTDYWIAYSKYYTAIYLSQMNDSRASSRAINDAIRLLERVRNKNSETYALLAYMQSFSLKFAAPMAAAVVSSKVRQNLETAIRLDSTNLRAWFVMASNDYYTPAAFGGGTKFEEYLLKAISLDEQATANPYLPSWGKSEAYVMLIGYYISKNDYSSAKEHLKKAQELFPDNYMLIRYEETLQDK
jgi:tetratricopeptide (TPR) repeat protein